MKIFCSRVEVGLVRLVCAFIFPGVAYLYARLCYMGLQDDGTMEKVPIFDIWALKGLTIIAAAGYGLGAWFNYHDGGVIYNFLALFSILNGLPVLLVTTILIEDHKVS